MSRQKNLTFQAWISIIMAHYADCAIRIKGRNGLQQPVSWFQECSLPTELCDKHQALKKLQRSIGILIMTLLKFFFPIHGKTSQPVGLGRFSPSVPLFIYSYPLPPSANSWPSFSAFGRRQQSSLERQFGIRQKVMLKIPGLFAFFQSIGSLNLETSRCSGTLLTLLLQINHSWEDRITQWKVWTVELVLGSNPSAAAH